MQRLSLVRYRVKPDHIAENEALARAVFAALRDAAPPGVSYALFRDGAEFVHLFVNSREDQSDAVTERASFKAYMKDLASRCEAPPEVVRHSLDLLDSYGLA